MREGLAASLFGGILREEELVVINTGTRGKFSQIDYIVAHVDMLKHLSECSLVNSGIRVQLVRTAWRHDDSLVLQGSKPRVGQPKRLMHAGPQRQEVTSSVEQALEESKEQFDKLVGGERSCAYIDPLTAKEKRKRGGKQMVERDQVHGRPHT